CKKALDDKFNTVIVSSDKDICQLLQGQSVVMYNPTQDRIVTEDVFIKEWGFAPPLVIDYLSLVGDSVDNVPGAKGIGKVGASKLIKEFGPIENIFHNLDSVSPKVRQALQENRKNILLSRDLVKLECLDLDIGWCDLRIKDPDYANVYKMFQDLEFKKLLKSIPAPSLNVKVEVKDKAPEEFLRTPKEKVIFFVDADNCHMFDEEKKCIYTSSLPNAKAILEDENIKKISYDFKEQLLNASGSDIKGIWFDIKIAGYLLDSSFVDYNLGTLAAHYLEDFIHEIPLNLYPYYIYRLYGILSSKLRKAGLEKLFFEVEMPLIYVLTHMQSCGMCIDKDVMYNLLEEVDTRLKRLNKDIFKIAGKTFNLNSPTQLRVVLFEELKIPPLKKTKTGYSTSEEVLQKLAQQHPIAELLLEFRQLNKLKTTYIVPLIQEAERMGQKLHAKFNQTSTQTGRLSSSSPNLQSIPTKGKFSSHLRKAFISSFSDGCILSCDYSQIELRILAHFSGDERLGEAFKNNLDIHRYTASLLFGIEEDKVEDSQRNLAKRVNFGILYGMSSYGLSRELGVNPQEADIFIQDYFLRYPKVKAYIEKVYREAEEKGFVRTILGRRRHLPDFKSPNPQLREFAHRQAINTPIQGSCADLIKLAMVRIYNELKKKKLRAQLIIQIHDELVFDLPRDQLKEVAEIVKRNMEESIRLSVPIRVNLKVGKNWAEMKEVQ
ncbi:MAG: hypothetical protein JSW40_05660, partial [Candidatus Omnitrophota bacterium]